MFQLLQLFIVLVFVLNGHVLITSALDHHCSNISKDCPNGEFVKYPFYIEDPDLEYGCGYPGLSVKCSDRGRPIISLSNHSYYLYLDFGDIRVVEVGILDQICPQPRYNFSLEGAAASSLRLIEGDNATYFHNCTTFPKDVTPNLPCTDNINNNASESSFIMQDYSIPVGFNWYGNCQQKVIVPLADYSDGIRDGMNFTEAIKSGIRLELKNEYCKNCENSGGSCLYIKSSQTSSCLCNSGTVSDEGCSQHLSKGNDLTSSPDYDISYMDESNPQFTTSGRRSVMIKLAYGVGLFAGIGVVSLMIFFIYRRRYSKYSSTKVEVFLQSYETHGLQRYKYSDIKKMTNSFNHTLGQGGFGSVYKGKLLDGRMVAVKLLNELKGDGDDFINEVATIGRTNHVNVVNLIGFCSEKTKRALVYEFLANGSLEKFIYKERSLNLAYSPALGWEKLYQIALGIARGLEYLHRGCNNRILHFDIKPHNILLDSDFVPKISDFGLAKLSKTRDSVVSVVGTRGTSGYIAPEVYCRNFGAVSYKSDVYSYGMMLFEMIGGRKNIDATVENISEIYFPHWIYNHLNEETKVEVLEDTQIHVSKDILEDEIARKMIIVALWCIQAHPVDRPSMKKVAEMLEETNDKLQMPPNPSFHTSSGQSPASP